MSRTFVMLITLLIAACSGGNAPSGSPPAGKMAGGPAGPGGAMPPPEVEVLTVTPAPATITQDLPGRLVAYRTAQVRARVEGIVEQRLFEEGSEVKAGQMLFRLDDRTLRAAVLAARAEVAAAKAVVARYQPLLDIAAISRQEFDAAEARLRQAEAQLARAELDLENAQVPAPIAGRIGRALVTEGALVGRGEATHLATIEQLDPIYVNFTQPGADLLRLRQALQSGRLKKVETTSVQLALEDGTLYPLPGKLTFSDLAVDPATGSVTLRALLPNPQRALLPGMYVRVRFPEAEQVMAMRVPQRAVLTGPQGQSVLLVDEVGKVVPRPVQTGAMSGSDWIIERGLQGGERVIVHGLQKARPGSEVKAVPWTGAPSGAAGSPPEVAAAKVSPAGTAPARVN